MIGKFYRRIQVQEPRPGVKAIEDLGREHLIAPMDSLQKPNKTAENHRKTTGKP